MTEHNATELLSRITAHDYPTRYTAYANPGRVAVLDRAAHPDRLEAGCEMAVYHRAMPGADNSPRTRGYVYGEGRINWRGAVWVEAHAQRDDTSRLQRGWRVVLESRDVAGIVSALELLVTQAEAWVAMPLAGSLNEAADDAERRAAEVTAGEAGGADWHRKHSLQRQAETWRRMALEVEPMPAQVSMSFHA